jgi:C4-dicarboxylate-specific signal transduction histidine kinase
MTAATINEAQSLDTARTLTTRVTHLEEQHARMAEKINVPEAGMLQAARLAAVGQLAASIGKPVEQEVSPYLTIALEELGA